MGRRFLLMMVCLVIVTSSGCDRIYRWLQKSGAEERDLIGEIVPYEANAGVLAVQQRLKIFGYAIGNPDGILGVNTRNALEAFQEDQGIEATRFIDRVTWDRLMEFDRYGLIHAGEVNVAAVQVALKAAGLNVGSADGKMGRKTQEALEAFQQREGLKPDGKIGFKTLSALKRYLMPLEAAP